MNPIKRNLVCVATRIRQLPSKETTGFEWAYLDGDVADDFTEKQVPGLEVQRLYVEVIAPPVAAPAKATVVRVGGRDAASACYHVGISGKEFVRHGDMYTRWFEAREARTGAMRRRNRIVTSDVTRARIDDAINEYLDKR